MLEKENAMFVSKKTLEEVLAWAKRKGVTVIRFGPEATPPVMGRTA